MHLWILRPGLQQMHLWILRQGLRHLDLPAQSYAPQAMDTPPPPFPTTDPMNAINSTDPRQHNEYCTEQTVHAVTFKIYTFNGGTKRTVNQ